MKPGVKSVLLTVKGIAFLFILGMMVLSACQKESRGFVLPPGDIAKGRQLFTDLNCNHCHSIANIAWAGTGSPDGPEVKLGGEVTSLKTYGELVTSMVNPSHKISQKSIADERWLMPEGTSKMESYRYNDVMTVQQLVDVVAFLQSEYKLVLPENTYPYF